MDKERAIIARFANALNGDDGAVLSSRTSRASVNSSLCAKSVSNLNCAGGAIDENIAISKDLFIEDVHFRRSWLTPYQIGAKAAIVNISDAIAMNASPKYALFGLGVPRNMPQKDVSALCDGVRETLESYGASVVGGDTVASDKITISLTIISNLNARPNKIKAIFHPFWAFFRLYVLKGGFLEGWRGYVIARLYAQYTFWKYVKTRAE